MTEEVVFRRAKLFVGVLILLVFFSGIDRSVSFTLSFSGIVKLFFNVDLFDVEMPLLSFSFFVLYEVVKGFFDAVVFRMFFFELFKEVLFESEYEYVAGLVRDM